eukprot:302253-Amphidinium_carterae.1
MHTALLATFRSVFTIWETLIGGGFDMKMIHLFSRCYETSLITCNFCARDRCSLSMAGTSFCLNTGGRHARREVITCGAWLEQHPMATFVFWRRIAILK